MYFVKHIKLATLISLPILFMFPPIFGYYYVCQYEIRFERIIENYIFKIFCWITSFLRYSQNQVSNFGIPVLLGDYEHFYSVQKKKSPIDAHVIFGI